MLSSGNDCHFMFFYRNYFNENLWIVTFRYITLYKKVIDAVHQKYFEIFNYKLYKKFPSQKKMILSLPPFCLRNSFCGIVLNIIVNYIFSVIQLSTQKSSIQYIKNIPKFLITDLKFSISKGNDCFIKYLIFVYEICLFNDKSQFK